MNGSSFSIEIDRKRIIALKVVFFLCVVFPGRMKTSIDNVLNINLSVNEEPFTTLQLVLNQYGACIIFNVVHLYLLAYVWSAL